MHKKVGLISFVLLAVLLLGGCALRTVDEMYTPPKRSTEFEELQKAIDAVMPGLDYCAPLTGENQQSVQMADLDGDGDEEYLLYARGSSEKPLQILVFSREEEKFTLRERIESHGSGFEFVEYLDIDGSPGLELVVGCQVSEQVLRYLSVYRFSQEDIQLMMTANYYKFVGTDLDGDDRAELMVIAPGATETDKASAALYSMKNGKMERSREISLSASADQIKRIMVGNLQGGENAVYVASALEEQAIITDIFALKNGDFTNVSFSNDSGTSVQTLRNYYVYADDIDQDGVLELPSLIDMIPYGGSSGSAMQHLIRWYAMNINGLETDKMFTFHNLADGWYLQLDSTWASRVSVVTSGGSYSFYIWDSALEKTEKLMAIDMLTGSDREKISTEDGRFLLHRAENVLFAAKIEDCAASYGVTQENLADSFHLIFKDWKTGET